MIAGVRDALARFEADRSTLPALAAAVTGYAQFQWAHMRLEEEQILPLAEKAGGLCSISPREAGSAVWMAESLGRTSLVAVTSPSASSVSASLPR